MNPMLSGSPDIEMRGVKVARGRRIILDEIDWRVARGESWIVAGPNGAGKTTLLNVAAGYVRLSAGKAAVFGLDVARGGGPSLRVRIGHVPQLPPPELGLPVSCRELVLMGCFGRLGPWRRPGRKESAAAERLLSEFGLAGVAESPVGLLSGGELRRAHLARAMMQEPEMLLMDEPAAHLDVSGQRMLLDLIARLAADGKRTLILVTHDLTDLPRMESPKALLLANGKTVASGPAEQVFTRERLESVFGEHAPAPAALGTA
jgi:iron complex transport system ATP-binding protein